MDPLEQIVMPRTRSVSLAMGIVLTAGLIAAAAGGVASANKHHQAFVRQIASRSDYWTVTGPPCVDIGKAAFDELTIKPRHVFEYADLHIDQLAGNSTCYGEAKKMGAAWDRRECMFTSPGVLHIKDGRREAFYFPGIGQPVTITVTPDGIHCVMASHLTVPLDPRWRGVDPN